MNFKNTKEFIVYALILKGIPVYVGCTNNLIKRKIAHRKNKTFDYAIIVKSFDTREEALIAENAIIRFMSLFPKSSFLNALNEHMVGWKEFMDSSYHDKEMEVKNG